MRVARRRLMGVAFIAVIALIVWFCIAVYSGMFTRSVTVLLLLWRGFPGESERRAIPAADA